MKRIVGFVCWFLFAHFSLLAQDFQWKAGLNYFFDNTEYAKSTLTKDQTTTGVHFSPEIGMAWDSVHRIYVGTDLLKTSGSQNILDAIHPIAYYQYKTSKTSFYACAFPRSEILSNYSDLFFQDSVSYYRPTLQGLFWQHGNQNSFFNLWLDWTGHQTALNRETFFIGASAHKKLGHYFTDFQSYMFHYANTNPRNADFHVCDNVLAHLSFGIDYSNQSGLDTLLFAVGILGGIERERGPDQTYSPVGLVLRGNAEYSGFGTQNTLYIGSPRQLFYERYGNEFYWNNPFLRSGFYLQSKWYLEVIRSRFVNGRLSMNLHFSERKVMYEQVFTIKASLNSLEKNHATIKPTLLARWFK